MGMASKFKMFDTVVSILVVSFAAVNAMPSLHGARAVHVLNIKPACHNSTSAFTFNGACNKDDGIAVPACSPGYTANQSCINHNPANYMCSPCPRGFFQPYYNNCTKCLLCSKCQKVLTKCTIVKDTVCTSSTPSSGTAEETSHNVPGTSQENHPQSTRIPDVPANITNAAPTDRTSSDLNVTPESKYGTEESETQVDCQSNRTYLILMWVFASAFIILLSCNIFSCVYKTWKKNRKQRNHGQNGNIERGTQAHQTGRRKPEAKSPVNPAGDARQNGAGAAGEVSANDERHPGHEQSVDTQSATTPGSHAESSFETHPTIPGKKFGNKRKRKEQCHAGEDIPLKKRGKGETTKGTLFKKNIISSALDTDPTPEDNVRSDAMKAAGKETQDSEDALSVHSIPAETSSGQAGIFPSAGDPQFLAGATKGAKEGKTTPAEILVTQEKMSFTKCNPNPSSSGAIQKASSDVPEDDSEESDRNETHFAGNGQISSLGPIRVASDAIVEDSIPGHKDQSRSIEDRSGRVQGSAPVTMKFLQDMAKELSRKGVEEVCREWDLEEHIIEDKIEKFDLLKEVKKRKGNRLTYAQVIDCLNYVGNRNAADQLIEKFNIQL